MCPIAEETASAALTLCTEYGPNGFGFGLDEVVDWKNICILYKLGEVGRLKE